MASTLAKQLDRIAELKVKMEKATQAVRSARQAAADADADADAVARLEETAKCAHKDYYEALDAYNSLLESKQAAARQSKLRKN